MTNSRPALKPIDPKVFVVTHRCREWRLNVYRKWKKTHQGAK